MPTPLTPKAHDPLPPLTPSQRILFEAARERIRSPEAHATRFYALDAAGVPVSPVHPTACAWCAVGTMLATLGVDDPTTNALSRLMIARFWHTAVQLLDDDRIAVTSINDNQLSEAQLPDEWRTMTPHQRILDIYDRILS